MIPTPVHVHEFADFLETLSARDKVSILTRDKHINQYLGVLFLDADPPKEFPQIHLRLTNHPIDGWLHGDDGTLALEIDAAKEHPMGRIAAELGITTAPVVDWPVSCVRDEEGTDCFSVSNMPPTGRIVDGLITLTMLSGQWLARADALRVSSKSVTWAEPRGPPSPTTRARLSHEADLYWRAEAANQPLLDQWMIPNRTPKKKRAKSRQRPMAFSR